MLRHLFPDSFLKNEKTKPNKKRDEDRGDVEDKMDLVGRVGEGMWSEYQEALYDIFKRSIL